MLRSQTGTQLTNAVGGRARTNRGSCDVPWPRWSVVRVSPVLETFADSSLPRAAVEVRRIVPVANDRSDHVVRWQLV